MAKSAPPKASKPKPKATEAKESSPSATDDLFGWVWLGIAAYAIFSLTSIAYRIRMGAIEEFGAVIHEYDPVSLPSDLSAYVVYFSSVYNAHNRSRQQPSVF